MRRGAYRVLAIAGTRPEAIKMAPVVLEASRRRSIDLTVLATGQHVAMFDEALAAFGLVADRRIEPVAADPCPDIVTGRMVAALMPAIAAAEPDLVLVQGDTISAHAGAIAAAALALPVAHIEAGLRSGDPMRPWPEERNRIDIDAIAALLFAPTATAAANLAREGAVTGEIVVTGNSGIDALLAVHAALPDPVPCDRQRILMTCHRRESHAQGIAAICRAALALAARGDVDILCPIHPNPAVRNTVEAMLSRRPGIVLVEHLPYPDAVAALARARLVLTDSGGVQEEAATLGVPTLVLRDETERPEGVASGNLLVVGTDPARIVAEATRLLDDPVAHAAMTRRTYPFGTGDAAVRILDAIERYAEMKPTAPVAPLRVEDVRDGIISPVAGPGIPGTLLND